MAAEPDAVAALLAACAGLPLAISIAAAHAAAHPDFPLGARAGELHDEATRLDALDTGELAADLRAVFATSHRALAPAAATLFELLGVVPGPDIGLAAAAALADLPEQRTRVLLRELERAHLVRQHQAAAAIATLGSEVVPRLPQAAGDESAYVPVKAH